MHSSKKIETFVLLFFSVQSILSFQFNLSKLSFKTEKPKYKQKKYIQHQVKHVEVRNVQQSNYKTKQRR